MTREERLQVADDIFGLRLQDIRELSYKLIDVEINKGDLDLKKYPRNIRRNYWAYIAWINYCKEQDKTVVQE
jgi:hypothetical protein